jgi:polyisoprenyl-teichoic acid--peptidoglycan teichoic acid transferase
MQQTQKDARPRARSPFAAAFLSLIFPGLGHAYAGAFARALAFAAFPILAIALGAGLLLRMDRIALLGLVLNPFVLSSVFVVNLIVLLYRIVAIVDAYRVTEFLNAHDAGGDGRLGPGRLARNPLSIAGLLAVILVMAGSHIVVARYDVLAMDVLDSPCIFVGDDTDAVCTADASDGPDASDALDASDPGDSLDPTEAPTPTPAATPVGSALPQVSIPLWDGKARLNILLIGADQRPSQGSYNTDTLIVVSIDPVSKQVAMFSLPRDTVDVPIPAGPARSVFGSTYSGKVNSWFSAIRNRADLYPGNKTTRGYNGLKAMLGELYGLDIKYFVEVNFQGFMKVVDALGGVTINVQVPVSDDRYPGFGGKLERVYIPSGIQHMDGAHALQYARSRHSSNDFDRGQRQQRVLLSLREQADPQVLIPHLTDLVTALKSAVRTDIPVSQLDDLLGLASSVDTKDIRSYVFAPPFYQTEFANSSRGYIIVPKVARIRTAVKNAFKTSPADEALREKLANEGANVWVLSGLSDRSQPVDVAGYLEYVGLAASAPRQAAQGAVPSDTKIVVYNGAADKYPETIAYLESRFKVVSTTATDPAIRTDIIVTIGRGTPKLSPPVGP